MTDLERVELAARRAAEKLRRPCVPFVALETFADELVRVTREMTDCQDIPDAEGRL